MAIAPYTLRDLIKEVLESGEGKIQIVDSDGNVISDISLSTLRDALKGADNKDFSTLEADVESILAQLDVALSTRASESTLSGIKTNSDNIDIALSAHRDAILDPVLDQLILNNETVASVGESDVLNIRGAKHVDVLVYVGAPTGSPDITFHLQVIEPTSGKVIRTYDGSSLTAEGSDYITVDGLTLGTHVKVTWDGTLDASNYFSGCFVRIVAKR